MKRAAIVVAVLGVCAWSFGQSNAKPAGQNTPAAGQAAAPPGKRPPAAKTQPEFEAYKAAVALTDPAALEKAADDFAAKFPDSELRGPLYTVAMGRYQGNPDKMMEMGKKILAIDADDPAALVGVAQAIVEKMHDTDLDKDQERADAKKYAERALVTVETDVPTSGLPSRPDQRLSRMEYGPRRISSWARCRSRPAIGRMRRSICGSPLTCCRSSRMRSRSSSWRSRWTCRTNSRRRRNTSTRRWI